MTTTVNMIFAVLAFALVFQSGSALRCWSCSSDRNPECADPMNITDHQTKFLTRDCESTASPSAFGMDEHSICKKIVQKDSGRIIVRRSCERPSAEERDITNGPCAPHSSQNHMSMVSCNICSTDLCNSATSISGSRVFQFSTIALVLSAFRSF